MDGQEEERRGETSMMAKPILPSAVLPITIFFTISLMSEAKLFRTRNIYISDPGVFFFFFPGIVPHLSLVHSFRLIKDGAAIAPISLRLTNS